MKCLDCNNIWNVKPNNLLSSNAGCPECRGNKATNKKAKERILKHIQTHWGETIKLVRFVNQLNELTLLCSNCNKESNYIPKNIIRMNAYPCRHCLESKTNINNFKDKMFKIHGEKLVPLEDYISSRSKIKFLCYRHGVVEMEASNALRANGCLQCAIENRRSNLKEFIEKLNNIHKNEYVVMDDCYINNNTKLKIKHVTCGYEWMCRPTQMLRGGTCPKCNTSRGEMIIGKLLEDNNIKYISQHTFDDCVYKSNLLFDFYIGNILVEYDGSQHFEPVDFAGRGHEWARENLYTIQQRDKTKNQYCIENDIPLIRIPYWEKNNLEYILDNVLSYFNIHKLNNEIDKEIVERYLVDSHWNHDTYLSWQHKENRYWLNN